MVNKSVPIIVFLVLAIASIAVIAVVSKTEGLNNKDSPIWSRGYAPIPAFEGYIGKAIPIRRA